MKAILNKVFSKKYSKIIALILFLLIVSVGFSYGYKSGKIGTGINLNLNLGTKTADDLNFVNDDKLSLNATFDDLKNGSEDIISTIHPYVTLKANSKTNTASYDYSVYFIINENGFSYSSLNTPELILTITDENNNAITNIEGLTYVTNQGSNEISGFDVTTKKGFFKVASRTISSNSSSSATTNNWTFTLTMVNLSVNQINNVGVNFDCDVNFAKDDLATSALNILDLNNYLKSGTPDYTVSPTDATSGIYETVDDYGTSYVFRGNINYNWAKFGKESVSTNCTNGTKDVMSASGEKITTSEACTTTYTYSCSNANTIFVGTSSNLDVCTTFGLSVTSGNVTGLYQSTPVTIEKDIYWRAVRINGDGSLRLIYTGNFAPKANQTVMAGAWTQIGSSPFNKNYTNNAYVGYMYGDINGTTYEAVHSNINASTIKTYIDNWYMNKTNLGTTNDDIVADNYFCYDRSLYKGTIYGIDYSSGNGIGTVDTGYGARGRLISESSTYAMKTNATPILTCPQANDMFTKNNTSVNDKITSATGAKIGLLSADEAVIAGATIQGNTTYYLYMGEYTIWLGSPSTSNQGSSFFGVSIFNLNSNGRFTNGSARFWLGVRPVISVDTTYLTSGNGTAQSPWEFSL